jgi:uncharacterized DUF497 family protein
LALQFEWDPQKAAANLAKHKVSFEGAATVFGDPLGRIVADPRHSVDEDRFVLLAFPGASVCLQSCTWNGDTTIRIISARRATRRERRNNEEIIQ